MTTSAQCSYNGYNISMYNVSDEDQARFTRYVNSLVADTKSEDFCLQIGVHDGLFHCDDVFATAILGISWYSFSGAQKINITRSRDPQVVNNCHFKVDVGGAYDPSRGYLDHHQRGGCGLEWTLTDSHQYSVNVPMAACGLSWAMAGRAAIDQVIRSNGLKPDFNEQIYNDLLYFIFSIDAADVGQSKVLGDYLGITLPTFISSFNTLNDAYAEAEYQTSQFVDLVRLASSFIANLITSRYKIYDFVKTCDQALQDSTCGVMILPTAGNWKAWMLDNWELTQDIKLLIYPSGNEWRVQTAPADKSNLNSMRCPAPEYLRGLRDDELNEVLHTAGVITKATFIHPNGFIGGAKTQGDAQALAQYWLANAGDEVL